MSQGPALSNANVNWALQTDIAEIWVFRMKNCPKTRVLVVATCTLTYTGYDSNISDFFHPYISSKYVITYITYYHLSLIKRGKLIVTL